MALAGDRMQGEPVAVGQVIFIRQRYSNSGEWHEVAISSETRMSWVVMTPAGYELKLPKKHLPKHYCSYEIQWSRQELTEYQWVVRHRMKIIDRLKQLDDFETWKRIALLAKYEYGEGS